jgi:prepilin-type N-terminal cleavage/methylation domain-containing protein
MSKVGLFGWFYKNLRGKKGQQGFTLIELLVVVTILGVLAGIVTLSLVGLTTNASIQSCNTEYKTVQAALDAYMANYNLDTVTPTAGTLSGPPVVVGTPTSDMTVSLSTYGPMYNISPGASTPNFTRNGKTQFTYAWDNHGKIVAVYDSAAVKSMAPGCKPS